MKIYNYIPVKQPIGEFYMCSIPAVELLEMVETKTRRTDEQGVQRERSSQRINEVRTYCEDPDAVFPTPIVVSIYDYANVIINEANQKIIIEDNAIIGDVIDGQHRLWGIKEAVNASDFMLPVVFMFNLTIEEKAYVFSTINSNQTKVDPSLIYDLFDVVQHRSPYKTVHELARAMNYSYESPFYNRLKMLGRKEKSQENATLSQGTFAKSILQLISNTPKEDVILFKKHKPLKDDPRCPLRYFFISDGDDIILKILLNCFNALKRIFREEWENPSTNILWKTTGFCGIIYSLRSILRKGYRESQLTETFFENCFITLKKTLEEKGITLTSQSFPGGGEQNQKKLANIITDGIANLNIEDYTQNLIKVTKLEDFVHWIGNHNRYELYDIASVLRKGEAPYNTIQVNMKDDLIEMVCRNADVSFSIPKTENVNCLKELNQKYMFGMEEDSWLKSMKSLEE